nr:hypothetical protein [Tanacetum cinerariifolium]
PKRPRNAAWYKEKAMLAEAQEAEQMLNEEQLVFLADLGIPASQAQTIIPHNAAFHTEDLDTYDSNCDDLSTAQAVLMDNISNYGSKVITEKAQRIKPTLYDGIVISKKHVAMPVIDDEEILILEEESRSKMSEKEKDPEAIKQNISHKPIDYEKLNRLTKDFGKCFTPQQELSAEQAFWLLLSNPTIESYSTPPVKVEVPSELPKNVNGEYFKENDLKAQLQDKDTTICKLKDTIKSLRNNNKEGILDHDRCDLATTNEELENSVAKLLSKNERLCKEINHVKQVFKDLFDSIKQTRVLQKEHSDSLIFKLNLKSMENKDLKAQIQDKVFVITSLKNYLRKLKGKANVDNATQIPSATTVAPGMLKLDLEPLAPKLVHNREFHINYLKHTHEQADILRGIVDQPKSKQPLDNALDFASKHAKRIQELLAYVQDTCPSAIKLSETKWL